MPKISAKFEQGLAIGGAKCSIKIGDFRQITHYNSKIIEDRCIVSIKVE